MSRVGREMDRYFYVYILTNHRYGTLYVGITNDLVRRAWEHRNDVVPGFTHEHKLHRLVWYEQHATALEAIRREKLIKKWHRDWKVNLIQAMNPEWEDLFGSITCPASD
jgi:putative endonuclease